MYFILWINIDIMRNNTKEKQNKQTKLYDKIMAFSCDLFKYSSISSREYFN